jgi:hypothetical protein
MASGVYSFADFKASITGVGGNFQLGDGSGAAEEGITLESVTDQNVMTIGADGSVMHSKIQNRASTFTVRLLKTSPVNRFLQAMYQLQFVNRIGWGKNVIAAVDIIRGDAITLSDVAFKKVPTITYATEGGVNEWTFDCGNAYILLGGAS